MEQEAWVLGSDGHYLFAEQEKEKEKRTAGKKVVLIKLQCAHGIDQSR